MKARTLFIEDGTAAPAIPQSPPVADIMPAGIVGGSVPETTYRPPVVQRIQPDRPNFGPVSARLAVATDPADAAPDGAGMPNVAGLSLPVIGGLIALGYFILRKR